MQNKNRMPKPDGSRQQCAMSGSSRAMPKAYEMALPRSCYAEEVPQSCEAG